MILNTGNGKDHTMLAAAGPAVPVPSGMEATGTARRAATGTGDKTHCACIVVTYPKESSIHNGTGQ